jgi:hypothetical protein
MVSEFRKLVDPSQNFACHEPVAYDSTHRPIMMESLEYVILDAS